MPIIKARSSSIIDSVDLRGQPTAVTAAAGTSTTQIASTGFVRQAVADLIASAPSVLDTLNELSAALGNDANFATTISTALAGKVALAGDTMTGFLTLSGAPTANLHAATKKYVDDAIDSQMIYSTDDVEEGTSNLYFTNARARSSVTLSSDNTTVLSYNSTTGAFTYTHPSSDGILEGSTNLYYTTARVRNDIGLTSDDNQILSYGTSTGTFTFTTPTTDKITEGSNNLYFTTARARDSISNGSNISYNASSGVISTQAAVWSVNGQTHDVVLDTDNIDEGVDNLYFTNARAAGAITLTSNDTSILSYSNGEFTFAKPNTDKVAEGSDNKYFTTTRARESISATGWTNLSYNNETGVISITAPSTTNVTEGDNLYFTTARARLSLTASKDAGDGAFSYNSTTGAFLYTGPDDADYRQAVSAAKDSGHGNLQYSSSTGVFTYYGPTNTNYRAAVSAVKESGDGNFSYNSTTGVFTYTGPSALETQAHFSAANDGMGYGSLSYDSETGVFTFAEVTSANIRGEISATSASGVTYDSATGVIALSAIPNSSLTNSKVTVNGYDISLGGSKTLNADDIAEAVGGTNKYLTDARWDARLATKTTTDLTEGDNLYYTQARFNAAFSDKTTSNLTEGTSLYFTTTRARNTLSGGTGVTYTASTGEIAIGQDVSTTSDVTFGDVTVSGDLTVNGTMTAVNSNTVTIADKNLTLAQGSANATQANGAGITIDGANATITYASGADTWNLNKSVSITGGLEVTTSLTAPTFYGNLTGNVTGNVTGELTGNASTATALKTARSIQGVSFDGTSNITVVTAGTGVSVSGTQVSIGQAVGTGSSVTFAGVTAPLTGNVTGDLTGNVLGNVTGTVSSLSNHTTDDVAEGMDNLYFSNVLARGAVYADNTGVGHGTLSYDVETGTFSFAKVTAADIRGELSATKDGGDGNFSYASSTGVFTYTGPDATDYRLAISATTASGDGTISYDNETGVITYTGPSASDTRAHFSATSSSGITYTQSTGTFALSSIPNSSLSNSKVTVNSKDVSLGASITLGTDDVAEGTTNKYYLDSRARNAISLTTSDSTVLSYNATTGAFTFSLSGIDTDEVTEGSINQYFTTARARASVSNGSNIDYDATTGVISTQAAVWSVNGQTHEVTLSTDNVDEGTQNLYFTNARAASAITLVTDDADILSYATGTGTLTFVTPTTDSIDEGTNNLYYTTARGEAAIAAASVFDLADVELLNTLTDGYTLVWSAALQKFVPQNIAVTATNLNFTGDGTTTSFSTGVEVTSIDNTQVYINGLIQAPTYSYTLSTVDGVTSIEFDAAPEANDYIMLRVSSTSSLTAGGVLNESSVIDGGTY